MAGAAGMTKVRFTTASGDVETLWVEQVGQDRYRLDNTPWYAYGVSLGDVVEARRSAPGRLLDFVRVVQKSGYRTLRFSLEPTTGARASSRALLERFAALGCLCEGAGGTYFAVGVPPGVSFDLVRDLLASAGHSWECADPTHEALFPEG